MKTNDFLNNEKKAASGAFRWKLLRIAQSLLAVSGVEWKEQHRTCWCSRSLKRGNETVDVLRNQARDGASFAGLNRCGNLHTCPVCAAKVAELRRKQLSAGMVAHVVQGGSAYLLTFTFPHEAKDKLDVLMTKFDKARAKFQNDRLWKKFQKDAGNITVKRKVKGEVCDVVTVGVVNSLEFTISAENGWHPHVHMLLFCKPLAFGEQKGNALDGQTYLNKDLESELIAQLKKLWVNCLFKVGLGDGTKLNDMLEHALSVRGGEKAAEYIAKFGRDEKWGASSELARSHAKIGAAGEKWGVQHFTPFQLLLWAEKTGKETPQQEGERLWAVHRFREYAEAVDGKRALNWSAGLKLALGVADVNEEEWIAQDEAAPEQVYIGTLTSEQYAILLSRKHVPQFLEYAATCADSQEDLDQYVDSIREVDKVASGSVLVPRFMGGGRSLIYSHV